MCGIAGAFGWDNLRSVAESMTEAVRHRGPDDAGVAVIEGRDGDLCGALGHRRLAILDLSSAGHQPMSSSNGRLSLTYNGEIYNFRALRDELARDGVAFHTECDTEVLLAGWQHEGWRFLKRLRGMYAFALWDRSLGKGYLVRDPFGIKPLYVARVGGTILFASEIRAILASGIVPRTISPVAVESYLANGSVSEPQTIIDGIESVPAGCVVEINVDSTGASLSAPAPFAWLSASDSSPSSLRDVLRDSVRHHLVSDVPVGLFLSGGLDSSIIAGIASEVAPHPLDTFTVTFAEQDFTEAAVARDISQRFGTRHHEIPLSAASLLDVLPSAFGAMDQPSLDGMNTFVVSGAVRAEGIKVALSGLGGDELFAGYPSFRRARAVAPIWSLPAPIRRIAAAAAATRRGARGDKARALFEAPTPALGAYRASRLLLGQSDVSTLVRRTNSSRTKSDALGDLPVEGLSLLQQVSLFELSGYMRNTLLRDSDVFSMSYGLELRVPFIDTEVVRKAFAAADKQKLRNGVSKPLLLDAVKDLLPADHARRPKKGFTLPFAHWMRGPLREAIEVEFSGDGAEAIGLDAARVRRLWRGFLATPSAVTWSRPWALYTLVRWARENEVALPDSMGSLISAGAVAAG